MGLVDTKKDRERTGERGVVARERSPFLRSKEVVLPLNSVPDDFTVDHWNDMGEAKTGINYDCTFRSRKVWLRE
jgi:hypothetical protein